ncbi:MAG: hypothetical protein MI747_02295 [Desulfobacterales bacterium]|nr:hypothetical protein [Desulfobacterales bacterium]
MKEKLEILGKLYALHDRALADLGMKELACARGCAQCCTCNVTLTGLEAEYIRRGLSDIEMQGVRDRLLEKGSEPRYRPALSMNGFARSCVEGNPIPEEENDPDWGQCPLLENHVCTIYSLRPFGCRSLVSGHSCSEKGYADMEPLILTLNNTLIQFIEALDKGGVTANLTDLLDIWLDPDPTRRNSLGDGKNFQGKFAPNEAIPVLMVEPAHQEALIPVVGQVQDILDQAGVTL